MNSQDTVKLLGKTPPAGARRDAVHVPVVPLVLAAPVSPGQAVKVNVRGLAAPCNASDPKALGIVDPFLRGPVEEGGRVWVFLKPGSITSLLHVWEHPALPDNAETERPMSPERWAELRELVEDPPPGYVFACDECPEYGVIPDWVEED